MTDGRITIDTKVDVVGDGEIATAVAGGRFDMGRFWAPWVSGSFPFWDFGSLPFLFAGIPDYEMAVRDAKVKSILAKSYAEAGLVRLAEYAGDGSSTIWSNKPVMTLEDLKGLKIRSTGLLPTYTLKLLGAAPVTMASGELAEAMRRGTVDAMLSDRIWAYTAGFCDVASYHSYWGFTPVFPNPIIINKEKYDSLPADLQQALQDASEKISEEVNYSTLFGAALAEDAAELAGITVQKPSEQEVEKAKGIAAKAVLDTWLKEAGPYAQDLLSALDPYIVK